jgi:hypothetical protein
MSLTAQQVGSVQVRKVCYNSFKEAYPNNWREILDAHQEAELNDSSGQSRAQRSRTFQSVFSKIVQTVRLSFYALDVHLTIHLQGTSNSSLHNFEMIVAMVGGEVNSDRGLGQIFVTEKAIGVSATTAI